MSSLIRKYSLSIMSQHKRPHYPSTISLLGLYYKKHLPSGWIHIFLRVVNRVARPPSAKGDIQIWTVFSHHPIKSGIPIFNVSTYKYHSSKWYTSSHHISHHSNKSGIPSLQQEWYSNSQHVVLLFFKHLVSNSSKSDLVGILNR